MPPVMTGRLLLCPVTLTQHNHHRHHAQRKVVPQSRVGIQVENAMRLILCHWVSMNAAEQCVHAQCEASHCYELRSTGETHRKQRPSMAINGYPVTPPHIHMLGRELVPCIAVRYLYPTRA